jgi:hypothetical protein
MWSPLVSRSSDLSRLVDEGYDLEIAGTELLIRHVPYVTAQRQVAYGTLISELTTNGTSTVAPGTHEIWFAGSIPCDKDGQELPFINQRTNHSFSSVVAVCYFSAKPPAGPYPNYYEKVTNYVRLLSAQARAIDPAATAQIYPPHDTGEEESVFRYLDAASSRAGISAVTAKLTLPKVAIIGLGGTGSYILDLIAKTPIAEIHLYDDDVLLAHNAFRTPGAASLSELQPIPKKVDYLFEKYDAIRRHIYPHPTRVDSSNIQDLRGMSFVFIAIDAGPPKQLIVEKLQELGVPFVDTGMGVYRRDDSLGGIVRVTTSADEHTDHIARRVSFGAEGENEYEWNIQTADLNMLNAAMAVVKWKKLCGYYFDRKREYHSSYTIGSNRIDSGDLAG